jgi:hypothetical protein
MMKRKCTQLESAQRRDAKSEGRDSSCRCADPPRQRRWCSSGGRRSGVAGGKGAEAQARPGLAASHPAAARNGDRGVICPHRGLTAS